MKKLLALVLCVMMFVAIIPTAAFADAATVTRDFTRSITNTPLATIASEANANKAIGHAKKNIEYMYGALAADTAVFETVKNMDSTVDSLVKEMFKDAKNLPFITASALENNTKLYVKDVLGTSIVNYLDDHWTDFTKTSWSNKTTDYKLGLSYIGNIRNFETYVDTLTGTVYLTDATGARWNTWDLSLADLRNNKGGAANVHPITNPANAPTWDATMRNWVFDYKGGSLTYTGKQDAVTGDYLYRDANGVIFAFDDATGNWTMTTDSLRTAANTGATYVNATPIKYVETFGKAVNDAFNDKENAANLQNIMYQMYYAKVRADVDDEMQTLRENIRDWENGDPLLENYHFNEQLFIPYAMVDWTDIPEAAFERIPDTIWAP